MHQSPGDLGVRFLRHWRALIRDGALIPMLQDYLDAVDTTLQPWTSIVDIVDADFQRWRLVGTGVCSNLGDDPTRKNFLDYIDPDQRSHMSRTYQLVCSTPCGQRRLCNTPSSLGRTLTVQTTSLPCMDSKGLRRHIVSVHLMDRQLSDGESVSGRLTTQSDEWIDLGAGIPPPP